MLTNQQKLSYILDSARRYFSPIICPFCKKNDCRMIDRKYVVTRLFEFENCHLYFRHPVEEEIDNKFFYQKEYTENDNITTSLDIELKKLISDGFVQDNKSAIRYIELF